MLQVIEVDGISTKASNISVLPIHIGQRYSVIIEASQEVGNYWIRAEIPEDCIMTSPDTINHNSALFDQMTTTGILQYEGAPSDTYPDSKKFNDDWSKNLLPCRDLDVDLLKPYAAVEPPLKVTDQINISVTLHEDEHQTTKAYINNQSWIPDITNPSIMKIMSESISAKQFPINANAYMYDTEELDIINRWHVELGMVFQLIEQQEKLQQLKMPDPVAALCAPGYQHTRRLALSSPDDDDYVTITGGGYQIHHKKPSTKRNTKKSLLFTKRHA
ncbi:5485_t:CDS:2, partial [Racocetra fulgida]